MVLSTQPKSVAAGKARSQLLSRPAVREAGVVLVVVLVAILVRVGLASQGWPAANSDEATLGLMTLDIARHGARPIFFYGQHYMGALQAYLAVPAFALLGPTSLALHVTTTLQFAAFALTLYAFTRAIYSPAVAVLTMVVVAFGPPDMLSFELRAGAGTQDTLLFGTLLLWLAYLRLRRPARWTTRLLLDAGIGAAAGVGLWADLLMLPFIAAAAAALLLGGMRPLSGRLDARRLRRLGTDAAVCALAFAIGAAPLLVANATSHGATLTETFGIAGFRGASGHTGTGPLWLSLPEQVAATLLVGIPHVLGSATVCGSCAVWPNARFAGSAADALLAVVVALPFTVGAVAVFALALTDLAVNLRRAASRAGYGRLGGWVSRLGSVDVRWWGRAMLVLAAALTALDNMVSPVSFMLPTRTERYLIGICVAAPLLADHLWRALARWRAESGARAGTGKRRSTTALLALGVFAGLLAVAFAGVSQALAAMSDRTVYGVPAGTRDLRLASFLAAHGGSRFYTTYWVCDLAMFETDGRMQCGVVRDGDAFAPGLNRVSGAWSLVHANAHPAYVFDAQAPGGIPAADRQIASALARGDPRFAGYVHAAVAGYDVYYAAR